MRYKRLFLSVVIAFAFVPACARQRNANAAVRTTSTPVPNRTTARLPEPTVPAGVLEPTDGVSFPVVLSQPTPSYPASVRNASITPPLYLYSVIIDTSGRVTSATLFGEAPTNEPYLSIERGLREAILATRYRPGTQAGKPIPVHITVRATVEVR